MSGAYLDILPSSRHSNVVGENCNQRYQTWGLPTVELECSRRTPAIGFIVNVTHDNRNCVTGVEDPSSHISLSKTIAVYWKRRTIRNENTGRRRYQVVNIVICDDTLWGQRYHHHHHHRRRTKTITRVVSLSALRLCPLNKKIISQRAHQPSASAAVSRSPTADSRSSIVNGVFPPNRTSRAIISSDASRCFECCRRRCRYVDGLLPLPISSFTRRTTKYTYTNVLTTGDCVRAHVCVCAIVYWRTAMTAFFGRPQEQR